MNSNQIIRFTNEEVEENIDNVVARITAEVKDNLYLGEEAMFEVVYP